MTRRLILNWQQDGTPDIVPVAELLLNEVDGEPRYEFGYIEGVHRAQDLGFQPFAAFPEIARRYVSRDLFPFFRNRVMPATRPDYLEYVTALGLTPDTASAVDLLGRSEGRRHTDHIETILAAERSADGSRYLTHFLVRGVRHVPGAEDVIRDVAGETELSAVLEPTNPKNPRARLLQISGMSLGYVPDYLLDDLDALDAASAGTRFTVVRVNPSPAPAHHRLVVRVDASWPSGFAPFSGGQFQPITPQASAIRFDRTA